MDWAIEQLWFSHAEIQAQEAHFISILYLLSLVRLQKV